MEYITTGDRIAVENFEIGSIYKVTFLNETEVYFMCCGKGKDFVMLMSNEPRLFSLTMSSAADVDAIDDYTPLPPPTPPTNLLQYQTGEPPFTFTTTDTELFSWYIKGPAGEKTANLLDWSTVQDNYGIDSNGNVSSQSGRIATTTPIDVSNYNNIFIKWTTSLEVSRVLYATFRNGVLVDRIANIYNNTSIDVSSADQIYICLYGTSSVAKTDFSNFMINEGTTSISYEPFGYKIPILCNTTTSIIYIEEALGENDILHSTETNYTIATDIGENILRIQGETQPSQMQIVYKWEFEYE